MTYMNRIQISYLTAIFVAFLVMLSSAVTADKAHLIGWRDLTYSVEATDDPYFGLGFEARKSLENLLELNRKRNAGVSLNENEIAAENAAFAQLATEDHDGRLLLEKEKTFQDMLRRQQTTMREEWANLRVRIPGYVVPLEYEDIRVVEFLLVPYAGACIHTPPPPVNQIIFVRYDQGFPMKDLFTPVWVTGWLSIESSQQSVALSDGTTAFEVGYSLKAGQVTEYQ